MCTQKHRNKVPNFSLKNAYVLFKGPSTRRRSKRFFSERRRKNYIKLTTSGQGEVLRPEIERSDRPEARQKSVFGWRGHRKFKKTIYY